MKHGMAERAYTASMEQIKRERETEAEVRALDADDIVQWIHRLEDEVSDYKSEAERAGEAVDLIDEWAGIDGAHHKQWLIDEIARTLLGDRYEDWVADWEAGEEGPKTYEWDTGVAP